jgi:hypothetical protein
MSECVVAMICVRVEASSSSSAVVGSRSGCNPSSGSSMTTSGGGDGCSRIVSSARYHRVPSDGRTPGTSASPSCRKGWIVPPSTVVSYPSMRGDRCPRYSTRRRLTPGFFFSALSTIARLLASGRRKSPGSGPPERPFSKQADALVLGPQTVESRIRERVADLRQDRVVRGQHAVRQQPLTGLAGFVANECLAPFGAEDLERGLHIDHRLRREPEVTETAAQRQPVLDGGLSATRLDDGFDRRIAGAPSLGLLPRPLADSAPLEDCSREAAFAGKGGEQRDRLDEVRLAGPVGADEDVERPERGRRRARTERQEVP